MNVNVPNFMILVGVYIYLHVLRNRAYTCIHIHEWGSFKLLANLVTAVVSLLKASMYITLKTAKECIDKCLIDVEICRACDHDAEGHCAPDALSRY